MSADARGWRLALVPEALLAVPDVSDEQPAAGVRADQQPSVVGGGAGYAAVLALLDQHGYGLLQLPPSDGGDPGPLLAVIADQVAEYAHHGYVVVAIGMHDQPGAGLHWRRLTALLHRRGVASPPRHVYGSTRQPAAEQASLSTFLAAQDVSDQEKRRWRV